MFRFLSVAPHPLLAPYIAKIQVFESTGRLPDAEKKLIVPNANLKLTLTYCNGIAAQINNQSFLQKANELTLTGLIDVPVILNPHENSETGTIIIEFNALGAYRFFRLPFAEFKNHIISLTDLIGKDATTLSSRLAEVADVSQKLDLLQSFLIKQLKNISPDLIYDYCVDRIIRTNGLVSVSQLEKQTGYSSRWLHRKFAEHLGTGAKNLAEIVRFRHFYHSYAKGTDAQSLKQQAYLYYHDQSHFIKAFKRFTGSTPTELQHSTNELANRHFTS